jgi:predicted KAP-like P-loop ATPase
MWPDNETDVDFLNFSGVADTVAEMIVQASGRPISIGVSGAWGIGKSSMIKLIQTSLRSRSGQGGRDFVFVEFNAWLYQGYDDARAALMDVIASRLQERAKDDEGAMEKVKSLLKRVNWLRAAKLAAGSAVALSFGLPPVGLIGEIFNLGKRAVAGGVDGQLIADAQGQAGAVTEAATGLIKPEETNSPPKEIQALRDTFEETLKALGVTLVVLIDDLDRCLPETTISTLEAIRLFLFLKDTAFVIAADSEMIKHAVRKHFEGVPDEALVTNYFDKLIQIPTNVPLLGTQEVRAYMMLLFIENSDLFPEVKTQIRTGVLEQLKKSWQGKRVDSAFVQKLHASLPPDLIGKLDTAERLAPIMTTTSGIAGNPRLIKRFLNALAIRMTISDSQGVGVDEKVLAKLMLFERLGNPKAFSELRNAVNGGDAGKPAILKEWEEAIIAGNEPSLPKEWDEPFAREWLGLSPALANIDLRGALYVSREHAPVITPEDRLSSVAAETLTALIEHPDMAASVRTKLADVPRAELAIIMDRLLEKAREIQEWGVPTILEACIVVAKVDPAQGLRLAAFLSGRPPGQIKASIVPKIASESWAKSVLDGWKSKQVSEAVKKAIAKQ